ncbi:MAG: carotenoid oxygenase family protein [Enhygromyxa sp.]
MTASPGALDHLVSAAQVHGRIPDALRGGRMLSNGPGWTAIHGWTVHPFDGHGYLRSLALTEEGGVELRARFVETRVYRDEREAQRMVHRGLASNVGPRFWQNLGFGAPRNVANTTIIRRGQTLLAGWEGGAPHALDAETLETLGEATFGGTIEGQATLAHMHLDAAADRLLLCSVKNGPKVTLTFREFDGEDRLSSTREAMVKGPIFTHDFAFTPSWYVVGGNPLRFRVPELVKTLVGASTLLRSLEPKADAPGEIHLIPRRGGGPVRTVRLPGPAFVIHFGNAFERDGAVFLDVCAFSSFEFGEELGYTGPTTPFDPALPDRRAPQRLYRVEIPANSDQASWRPLVPHGVDFPRIHPRGEGTEVAVLYGACRRDPRYSDPFDSIIRVDLRDPEAPPQLWSPPGTVFVGEPLFVPESADPRSVAGHVIAIVSDGERRESRLVILDAAAIDAGPVAWAPLPLLPVAFHGDWDSADALANRRDLVALARDHVGQGVG